MTSPSPSQSPELVVIPELASSNDDIDVNALIASSMTRIVAKYRNNRYMLNRFIKHVNNLPKLMENIEATQIIRQKRRDDLEAYKVEFINRILPIDTTADKPVKYLYISQSNQYATYDGADYEFISEDRILANMLHQIAICKPLKPIKKQVSHAIMRRIKQHNFFGNIPESVTIQKVLEFFNINFFDDKIACKYFLTSLGDTILQNMSARNHPAGESFLYYVNPKFMEILNYLNQYYKEIFTYTGNITTHYRTEYRRKPESAVKTSPRIIPLKTAYTFENHNNDYIKLFIRQNYLNIFAVCAHYSDRHDSAEDYLQSQQQTIFNSVMLLERKKYEEIINDFIGDYIKLLDDDAGGDTTIALRMNDVCYLWDIYTKQYNIPQLISRADFKTFCANTSTLKDRYNGTLFRNTTSLNMENANEFQIFWNNNMDKLDKNVPTHLALELSEITDIYNNSRSNRQGRRMTEDTVRVLIENFYKDWLDVDFDGRTIVRAQCKLWRKMDDINEFIEHARINKHLAIDIDDVYKQFCKYQKKMNRKMIVGKHCFICAWHN